MSDFYYEVCDECKIGSLTPIDNDGRTAFAEKHFTHGTAGLSIAIESIFLSEYLKNGYVDPSRPGMRPIPLKAGTVPPDERPKPLGEAGPLQKPRFAPNPYGEPRIAEEAPATNQ